MKRVPIFTIQLSPEEQLEEPERKPEIYESKIIALLKAKRLYRPDLMYRGVNVSEDQLEDISRYGSDKTETGAETRLTSDSPIKRNDPDNYESTLDSCFDEIDETLSRADFQDAEEIQEDLDPNLTCVLPEQGLLDCITEYCELNNYSLIPVILCYKAKSLIRHSDGKKIKELTQDQLLDHTDARYFFKTNALEAVVAAFKLDY